MLWKSQFCANVSKKHAFCVIKSITRTLKSNWNVVNKKTLQKLIKIKGKSTWFRMS